MFQFDHGGKKNEYPEKITHLPQFTVLIWRIYLIETTWSVFSLCRVSWNLDSYTYVSEILFSQNVNICFIISEFVWTLTFGSSQRPNFILNFWILDKERHFVFIVTRLDLPWGHLTHCQQFITSWMKLDFGPVVKSADYSKCDLLTLLFTSR